MIFPFGRPSMSRRFELVSVASVQTSQQHVRTPFSVQQVKRFLSKHRYEKTAVTVRITWLFRPDTILEKASSAEYVQPFGHQTSWSKRSSLNMKIAYSWSATFLTLGQHRPDVALFKKEFQANLESRSHSCPSECRLRNSNQMRIWFSVAYK